jgi:hypothetical protein
VYGEVRWALARLSLEKRGASRHNAGVISKWREETAIHLAQAARELELRHDRQVERHIQVAIGYLERAGQPGNSRNAMRLLEALKRALGAHEQTLQMKLTPDDEPWRDSMTGEAPPSLPAKALKR